MEFVGRFLIGAAVLVAFVLLNGGYVYKTTCPLASGGKQTSWTYGIYDIVPYVRSTKAPCYSHTGTRLALSAIGIWPLGHSTKAQAITDADRDAAESLHAATSAITAEYARERAVASAFTEEVKRAGLTAANRQKLIRFLNDAMEKYQSIKDALDRPIKASDSQLIEARKSLSTWLGYEIGVDRLFFSATSMEDFTEKLRVQYGANSKPSSSACVISRSRSRRATRRSRTGTSCREVTGTLSMSDSE